MAPSETSSCSTAAEPARPLTITVCAGRWGGGGCGGGSGGGAGLSGERLGRELAEWRSQGSELAEWRSQVRELAESAAGCRTVKSGCRTVPAQAVHISTHWDLELWVSPERGCSPVEGSGLGLRLCIVCLHASQCSQWLCFSRRLLQRLSQGTVGGPGVVERWPTVHSNSAPKMGAARICGLWGHCRAPGPIWGVFGSSLGGRNRGVLQAEGQQMGSGVSLSVSLSVCLPVQMGQLVERWPLVHNALTLWDSGTMGQRMGVRSGGRSCGGGRSGGGCRRGGSSGGGCSGGGCSGGGCSGGGSSGGEAAVGVEAAVGGWWLQWWRLQWWGQQW